MRLFEHMLTVDYRQPISIINGLQAQSTTEGEINNDLVLSSEERHNELNRVTELPQIIVT